MDFLENQSNKAKPILDLKGIELGMTTSAYRAIKADLQSSIGHNLQRCGWTEKDCVTHIARALPISFKAAAVKMEDTSRLFWFLDQQFLTETSDQEEEEWEEMRIGVRTVAEFATDIEAIAERLDKTEEQTNRCFVKGFREDYPELWRRLRIDHEGRPLTGLVRIAKQWIELTRGHESKTPRARVAAVTPSPSNEAALLADLTAQVRKLESQLANGPKNPPTRWQGPTPDEIDKLPWIEGYVQRTDTTKGYACVLPQNGPADSEKVHCLRDTPRTLRDNLQVGDLVAYKAQRDGKGLRAVALKKL